MFIGRNDIWLMTSSRGFKDIKYDILSSQLVNLLVVNQTRPDFNLADLILELAFLFLYNFA